MKEVFQKIVNSTLAILFAVVAVASIYYFTDGDRHELVSGSILDGLDYSTISSIEFVTPRSTVYPINGMVTINTVKVTAGTTTENVSGNDLVNSSVSFSAVACPSGTEFVENTVILPDDFAGGDSCIVRIEAPGTSVTSTENLTIEPLSCSDFQTSILLGQGSGFEDLSSYDLPDPSTTEAAGGFDFSTVPSSIDLNYPTTTVDGAQTFQIHIDFVSDISLDPTNGISERAKIVSNNGSAIYEIKVKDEGTGNEVQTALNFAYVFNDLLGLNSPVVAYMDTASNEIIQLETRELGSHTVTSNPAGGYNCLVNGTIVSACFAGGTAGAGVAADILTTPLTLDNEILQGDTSIVYAAGGTGEIDWISSHPSVLEVVSLSEANEEETTIVDFIDDTVSGTETVDETGGAYEISDCNKEYDADNVFQSESCTVDVSIPVEYDISGASYTVNVTIEGDVVPVTVQGSKLNGFLNGSATYTTGAGAGFSLDGTVTGAVSGTVSGQFSGAVSGTIIADVSGAAILDAVTGELTISYISGVSGIDVTSSSSGILSEVSGSFTSTVKKQATDISYVSMLYAKRPGTTLLTAMDQQGCIATFSVDVIEQEVILEMVGRSAGDVLDVSDKVQIDAYVGGANFEKDEMQKISAASGIEWFSSNEDVATIDSTGLLTALKPGVTNITARYDTGEAEIGTIESQPFQVTVNKISGLRVTFDETTQSELPSGIVDAAHESVIIAIHNPEAAGQTVVIEGQSVVLTLPAGDYDSDIAKVTAITDGLKTTIDAIVSGGSSPADLVNVTTIDGFPGMLILQPNNQTFQDASGNYVNDHNSDRAMDVDENGIIDIDTTALDEDLSILPTFSNAVPLPASETYGLMVVAEYDNGATKLLSPTQFTWVNTPVNYLEQASLDSGFIKMGEIAGTSTVVAQYENADASVVQSNYLTIKVDSGPVIEYVRRIGSGPVTKGSRISLQTKVTDVNTISDITSISTSLVYSNYDTYTQINSDSSAIWFSATPYLQQVVVEDQGAVETESETETTTTVTEQFKIYDIPVEIPVDQNLFDGVYKLVLTISDASNHTLNYVYPIRIGDIGEGDVNGDGKTNMVDVIIAFQIAAGILPNPTAAQLEAANVDGVGGVTLVDVILLFNRVSS